MKESVNILVLEDDPDLREMLAEVLLDEGYAVDTAERGEIAVTKAHEKAYDLVVADIRMDGLDGLEALSQVKSHRPDVGSLVVTGYADDAQSERALRLGLGGTLKKPFEAEAFLKAVREVLATRQQELQRSRRERSLRATADWALEMLSHQLGERFRRIVALASAVSREMHVSGPQVEELQAVALVAALQRFEGRKPQVSLPEGQGQALELLDERWDGGGPRHHQGHQIPLFARILSVVLAAANVKPPGEEDPSLSETLSQTYPGRFDPAVLEALDRAEDSSDERPTPESPPAHRQGLLSLGRALEQVGDFPSAEKAYRQILDGRTASREGVEALLGLARIQGATGQLEEARLVALRAPELGRQLGGASAGHAALMAGMLLARLDDEETASALVRESEQLLREARLEISASRARLFQAKLADGLLSEEDLPSLQMLFEPAYGAELAESVEWLLPLLLENVARGSELKLERAASRLVRQFSGEVNRALSLGILSTGARKAAVRVLEGSRLAETILETLALDPEPEVREAAKEALEKKTADGPETPLLRIYTLGRFEVYLGEEKLPKRAWRSQKNHYLFARIASQAGGTVLEEHLLEEFWPGDPEKARRNLYTSTSFLRRGLRSKGLPENLDYIQRVDGGLRLNPELPRWHDLEEVNRAAREADSLWQAGKAADAIQLYRRVSELYQGPYLEQCYMDWAVQQRHQVEQLVLNSHLCLARQGNEQRRYREALEHSLQALELDPCLQEAHHLAMLAQIGLGRPEQAVRQYSTCKKVLKRELEMEPSIDIERAHQMALLAVN